MKKTYEEPMLEIVELDVEDVLAVSINKSTTGSFIEINWSSLS